MTGYLRDEAATRQAFEGDWLRTGDLGQVAEDGSITLTGRARDEINRAGFKVQLAEIDALLESHSGVEAACAFALPHDASGEIVAAAVKLAAGGRETEAALRAWCLRRVRRELVPERWFFVRAIPASSRGKTGRDMVRRMCLEGEE